MEIPSTKALEIIGTQQVEIVVLREHVTLLQAQVQALQAEKIKAPDGADEAPSE